ncbi:hypothetical protein RGU12_15485 [Fredinandcohnia sp. QZ13]|uniref:hypothetical protein n=1 Tax=Fredinandcohnia sp. QZ13 TaxID=3073144 RepID=UPI0028533EAB|nr:hypothetical protein [Fredinandcohnia sp. QZ13]MDR4888911.1 hypothetical protein [Fredinandcohnia sp. QZ13]
MKRRILITGLIGVICLGFTQLLPVLASEDIGNSIKKESVVSTSNESPKGTEPKNKEKRITEETTNPKPSSDFRRPVRDSEQLQNQAKDLGIDTKGKTQEKIETEIRSTILQHKAKEIGIEVEGKSEEAIISELKEKYNEKPEITEPSSNKYEELRMKPESRRNNIIDTAKQHGIETEGKEFDAIVEELKTVLLKDKGE